MVIIYSDPVFEKHETGEHPESKRRLASIRAMLAGWDGKTPLSQGQIAAASASDITTVHTATQLHAVEELAQEGGGWLDADTIVSPASYQTALTAAGTCINAVDTVMSGNATKALCLVRPPGHHATGKESMGFCLFNNVAIAAQHALTKHGAQRILVVDWDVHHGNGTQDIFYEREDVFFLSIHRFPFYPGTGDANETGQGKGLGFTKNLPVGFGTSRKDYQQIFLKGLEEAARKAKPDLILISAGFDAHKNDPIGSLGLETEDYFWLTQQVKAAADSYCGGRIVSCLEGGYHLQALADSVKEHIKGLL